ncbi:hypothetical protein LTR94_037310, partial [Friedmanniomyces endolithicus]
MVDRIDMHDILAYAPALAAAVHGDEAAQRARNADRMDRAGHAPIDHLPYERRHPHARARLDRRFVQPADAA